MNEIGKRICQVLNIDPAHVEAVQINEIVNESPKVTLTCPLLPDEVRRILFGDEDA